MLVHSSLPTAVLGRREEKRDEQKVHLEQETEKYKHFEQMIGFSTVLDSFMGHQMS